MMADEMVADTLLTQVPVAAPGLRLAARLVDLAVLSMANLVLWGAYYILASVSSAAHPPFAILLALCYATPPLYITYFAVLTARSGQTLGKWYLGVQVQDASGSVPGPGASLGRASVDFLFTFLAMFIVGLFDYLWVFQRADRRTWHDLLTGTTVRAIGPSGSGKPITVLMIAAVLLIVAGGAPRHATLLARTQRSDDMGTTVLEGEEWVANRLAYQRRAPALGELVAVRDPVSTVTRVVGVGGDTLMLREGRVQHVTPPANGSMPSYLTEVPDGWIAVMGDAHLASAGATPASAPIAGAIRRVRVDDVQGQVLGVRWPLWHARAVQ